MLASFRDCKRGGILSHREAHFLLLHAIILVFQLAICHLVMNLLLPPFIFAFELAEHHHLAPLP